MGRDELGWMETGGDGQRKGEFDPRPNPSQVWIEILISSSTQLSNSRITYGWSG